MDQTVPQAGNSQIVVIKGANKGAIFEIQPGETTLGRGPYAQIVINNLAVSLYHAKIYFREDHWFLEDNGSANGTFINGVKILRPQILSDKDQIALGDEVLLEFRIGQKPQSSKKTIELKDNSGENEPITKRVARASNNDDKFIPTPPSTTVVEPSSDLKSPTPTRQYSQDESVGRDQDRPAPQLIVSIVGQDPLTFTLNKPQISVGREEDNDIVIPSKIISRHHAMLEQTAAGYRMLLFPDNTNKTYLNGLPAEQSFELSNNSLIRIGSSEAGELVTIQYLLLDLQRDDITKARTIQLESQTKLLIGRDPGNDIVLDAPSVSRFHAEITRIGQRYRIKDLHSLNKTFVNDQVIDREIWAKPHDQVRIGPFLFVLGNEALAQIDQTGGLQIEAIGLQKWVRKDLNLLQNISLVLSPREFAVIVGQSGGGKTTLLDALAGYRPASQGHVYVNSTDIYKHFEAVRSNIGYVPQRDIIHMELTVYESLDYAARLRMPPDTTSEERHKRIIEIMHELDLTHRRNVQASRLSGGQQKRVSIGVELLTKPGLFFLDEPTSGLDPGTETALMQLMRRLVDQGRTIVLITHATKNVMLADKVIFLTRGGNLAWFGPPDEALSYFAEFQTDHERRYTGMDFDQIYAILEDTSKGTPEEWGSRYRKHPAYHRYVQEPLKAKGLLPDLHHQPVVNGRKQYRSTYSPKQHPVSFKPLQSIRQFIILSARSLRILSRDRISLFLMLAAAPLVGLLDFILANGMGRNSFDYTTGDFPPLAISLFLFAIYGVLVGGLSQMREIVKEKVIYRRERLVNLQILPYILSKMWVAGLLALYHALAYTILHYLAFDMPGGILEFVLIYITVVLSTFAGMVMGLFASALAPNANSVPMIVILIMLPQIVLGGALIPLPNAVTALTSTRWAFQSFIGITGLGSDLAADPCWRLPLTQRTAMTGDEKEKLGCLCLGINALNQASCNFPGIGNYHTKAIDTSKPIEPLKIGAPPEKPQIPDPPVEPEDKNDLVAMNTYLQALQEHQQKVSAIQEEYEARVLAYQTRVNQYQQDLITYQRDLANWELERNEAISQAEGVMGRFHRLFGWAIVDKKNPGKFTTMIIKTWFAQALIIFVFTLLTFGMMKLKDRLK